MKDHQVKLLFEYFDLLIMIILALVIDHIPDKLYTALTEQARELATKKERMI